jgi:PTH1 family peptidyl-tRNA hydrolase
VIDEVARRAGIAFEMAPGGAEAFVARWRAPLDTVWLVKPLTFMNLSGEALGALVRYFRIETGDVLVVADDVDLPLGRLRARARGSAGTHNGFKSVVQHLGTEWPRLRVGVGRGDRRRDLADRVLASFDREEIPIIEAAITRAADAVDTFVAEGIETVMNRFNASAAEERSEENEADTKDSQA